MVLVGEMSSLKLGDKPRSPSHSHSCQFTFARSAKASYHLWSLAKPVRQRTEYGLWSNASRELPTPSGKILPVDPSHSRPGMSAVLACSSIGVLGGTLKQRHLLTHAQIPWATETARQQMLFQATLTSSFCKSIPKLLRFRVVNYAA